MINERRFTVLMKPFRLLYYHFISAIISTAVADPSWVRAKEYWIKFHFLKFRMFSCKPYLINDAWSNLAYFIMHENADNFENGSVF